MCSAGILPAKGRANPLTSLRADRPPDRRRDGGATFLPESPSAACKFSDVSTTETARGWIFRDCSEEIRTADLTERLRRLVESNASGNVDALLAAGELECALSDEHDPACHAAAELTDSLAVDLLSPHSQNSDSSVA